VTRHLLLPFDVDRITLEDIEEMIAAKEWYDDTTAPMNFHDIAFMFDCGLNTVRKVFSGKHPLQLKEQRDRKIARGFIDAALPAKKRGRPPKTHCSAGHAMTGDNVVQYDKARVCRACKDKKAK